jgi:hypothetical protein
MTQISVLISALNVKVLPSELSHSIKDAAF